MTHLKTLALVAAACCLQACSNNPDEAVTAPAEPRTAAGDASTPAAAATGRVYIVTPADGATVQSPVTVEFGIEGFAVAPAGTYEPATGHHHLLVDTELADWSLPIPADDQHIHFGKGQTATTIELAPGEHTLQLVLGDGNHVPHDPPLVSDVVTITVVE